MKTIQSSLVLVAVTVLGILSLKGAESSLNSSDQKFIKTAALQGKSEVMISELGAKKAESTMVKHVATMMIEDHTKTNEELTALAQAKGVELTVADDPKASKVIADLEKSSGKEFDKEFLDQLEADHKKTIKLFEEAATDSKDAAEKTLPVLKSHLEHVNKAQEAK
jgi:putative membrane protein